MRTSRLGVVISCCMFALACAGATVRPKVAASQPPSDALLVLPGFGYNHAGEEALRSLAPLMAAEAIDLYVPTFVSRSGLVQSRERLAAFIRANHLERYDRVHVFAFDCRWLGVQPACRDGRSSEPVDRRIRPEPLPGARAEDCARQAAMAGLDQIRARRVRRRENSVCADDRAGGSHRAWSLRLSRHGSSSALPGPRVVMVPTTSRVRHSGNRFDDCLYASLNHDQLYTRFSEVWPDLLAFIRRGQFTDSAERA